MNQNKKVSYIRIYKVISQKIKMLLKEHHSITKSNRQNPYPRVHHHKVLQNFLNYKKGKNKNNYR